MGVPMMFDDPDKYNRSEANVLGAKNLIPCPYYRASGYTAGNMTATYGEDGVITVNKTTGTTHPYFNMYRGDCFLEPNTKYIASLELENATDTGFEISLNGSYLADFGYKSTGKYEMSFTTPSSFTSVFLIDLHWATTTTETNAKVKVMIRLASDPDSTYEPYAKTNRELTTDKAENSSIAPVENGSTASQAYAIGKTFMRNGELCIASAAISSGGTLTKNTNYLVIPIGNEASVNDASVVLPTSSVRQMQTLPEGFTSSTNATWIIKKGSKVCVSLGFYKTGGTTIDSMTEVITLPVGYRPQNTIQFKLSGYDLMNNAVAEVKGDTFKIRVKSEDKGVYGYFEYEAFR